MAVTAEDLALYVGVSEDEPALAGLLASAVTLVAEHLGPDSRCPVEIRDLAVTTLAAALWTRRNAPLNIAQVGADGVPIRLANDPRSVVLGLLAPWKPLGAVG
jgi:hypothetical protein